MSDNLIVRTQSAYAYPLLIKNLFLAPVAEDPEQDDREDHHVPFLRGPGLAPDQ